MLQRIPDRAGLTAQPVLFYHFAVEKDLKAKRRRFSEFLRSKGLLMTGQRLAIFEAACLSKGPFRAEDLLQRVREEIPNVSLSTIHNTMRLLKQCGVVGLLGSRAHFNYYDAENDQSHRCYLLCADCGKRFECGNTEVTPAEEKEAIKRGFSIQSMRTEIRVTCNEFRKTASCKKQDRGSEADPNR